MGKLAMATAVLAMAAAGRGVVFMQRCSCAAWSRRKSEAE